MITNAILVSITSPRVSNGSGGFTAGTTTTIGVPCYVETSSAQIVAIIGQVVDVDALLLVSMSRFAAGVRPVDGGEVTYKFTGGSNVTRRVFKCGDQVKGGLSHYVLQLKQS